MTSYEYSDPVLDFDDANNFLSMLLSTVPSLDRSQKWDLGSPTYGNRLLFDNFDLLSSELVGSVAADSFNPQQSTFTDIGYDEARKLSLRLASYLDLITSHFAVSADGTPNTSIVLAHTLPGVKDIKEELALPYFPDLFATTVLANASSAESETESAEPDLVSPKHKVVAKDKVTKPAKKTKVSHNMIEKKYRTNINSKILELRDAVPTLRIATGKVNVLVAELEGLLPALKLNKASVLTKATEYIKHLERKNDIMRQQIVQLQNLIQDANMNPSLTIQREIGLSSSNSPGFEFNSQSFDTASDYSMYSSAPMAARPSQENNMTPNMMLGGLTTVMGSSLISGENFRGLAAIPFVPTFLSNPSPITLQLMSVIRTAVFVTGIAITLTPLLKSLRRSEKSTTNSCWITWAMVSLGLQLPRPLSPQVRETVIAHLLGKQPFSSFDLVSDFTTLSASEVTFESSFLYVLVGALLVKRFPLSSRALRLNMRWRASLLMNLTYDGEDANLKRLHKLIKSLDGLSMFDSDRLISRLNNLASKKPINDGMNDGENYLNYVELYRRNKNDLYGNIFEWRVLEIVHELNLTYLNVFAEDAEKRDEIVEVIKEDVKKIDSLILGDEGLLVQYFTLFKCTLFPELTPELMRSMKREIISNLAKVSAIVDGAELTDDEIISGDETSASESDEVDTTFSKETASGQDSSAAISNQKSMIYSLNLMNEEKFIVLTSSLISYYSETKDDTKSLELLQYLKFNTCKVPLSMLSFTCLVKLLCTVIKSLEDYGEDEQENSIDATSGSSLVLDSLVKLARGWLNDDNKKNYMTHKLRSDLSDLVMAKGMALSDF